MSRVENSSPLYLHDVVIPLTSSSSKLPKLLFYETPVLVLFGTGLYSAENIQTTQSDYG